jgi:hypothetical protein
MMYKDFPAQTIRTLRAVNEQLRFSVESNAKAISALEKNEHVEFEKSMSECAATLARASAIVDTLRS